MVPSKRRNPGVATNNTRATDEKQHDKYTAFFRETAAAKMKQAASMAEVAR